MGLTKCGALWSKEKNGRDYFTGEVEINGEKARILVFQNEDKEPGSKQPDFRIMTDDGKGDSRRQPERQAERPKPSPPPDESEF